jgi:hypothetical protein
MQGKCQMIENTTCRDILYRGIGNALATLATLATLARLEVTTRNSAMNGGKMANKYAPVARLFECTSKKGMTYYCAAAWAHISGPHKALLRPRWLAR